MEGGEGGIREEEGPWRGIIHFGGDWDSCSGREKIFGGALRQS
jgi:hypothetical protein